MASSPSNCFPSTSTGCKRISVSRNGFPIRFGSILKDAICSAKAISLAKAMQDGAWTSGENAVKDAEYTVEGIEAALAKIIAGNGRWSAYFARSGIEPLHIFYEDVHDDFDGVCQRVGGLLGLEAPVPATAQVDMQRQRNAQSDDWRRRFLAEAGDRNNFPAVVNPMGSRARKKSGWMFWRR